MTAVYPVTVHTYAARRDQVDYVMADHVNSLQDEVTAIELTLGTHPTTWTYTGDPTYANLPDLSSVTTWSTVRDRLDALQAHVARLDRVTFGTSKTTLPGKLPGPVIVVRNPGQSIPVSTLSWSNYALPVVDFDSDSVYTGGSSLVCPRTGWYAFTASTWTDVPAGDPSQTHRVANRLIIGPGAVAAHNSGLPWGNPTPHRINLAYSGPWASGEVALLQTQHTNTPSASSVTASAVLSATFVRETE